MEGLNTLRFLAAFFVIFAHGQISLWKLGVVNGTSAPIFNRGGDAVEFFFTLSGFLITLLLINESDKTNTISIRKFYVRRVLRIWPLYFLLIVIGFILFGYVYPQLFHEHYFEFSIPAGLALFVCFLPNIATSFFPTGILYPLWSIGVEEQYYLFWAPLIKLFRKNTLNVILVFVIISHCWYALVFEKVFPFSVGWHKFLISQKFYAMAMGGLFAYLFVKKRHLFPLNGRASVMIQLAIILLLLFHYLIGFAFSDALWFHFALSAVYGMLIVYTVTPNNFINLERQPFKYLGIISYGLYMFHMLVDYFLRMLVMKLKIISFNPLYFVPLYHICLLGLTIIIATLSYKYYESFFFGLKSKYS